jgi:hypothetical protein
MQVQRDSFAFCFLFHTLLSAIEWFIYVILTNVQLFQKTLQTKNKTYEYYPYR